MAKNPYQSTIRSNTMRKRDLQQQLRYLRETKRQELQSLTYQIKGSASKQHRESLRNRKTQVHESYAYRIESLQNQIRNLNEENARYRSWY